MNFYLASKTGRISKMVLDIKKIWILFSSLAIYFVHTKNAMGSIHGGEEFLHSTICEDNRHEGSFQDDAPEDDGSQYLNDTGNISMILAMAMLSSQKLKRKTLVPRYICNSGIYKHDMNSPRIYSIYSVY